jgi:uncharacterized membrane protein YgaE (UPF0421/DUF939 family)
MAFYFNLTLLKMKKLTLVVVAVASSFLFSCRESTREKTEEAVESIGEDIEDNAREVGRELKEGAEEIDNELEEELDELDRTNDNEEIK